MRGPGQRLATSAVYWRIRMPPSQHDTRRDAAHRQAPAAQGHGRIRRSAAGPESERAVSGRGDICRCAASSNDGTQGVGHGCRDHAPGRRIRVSADRGHPDHPAGRLARTAGYHQREEGLRPRPVRRLHGSSRRTSRAQLPGAGRGAPGCRDRHGRGPRRRRTAPHAAGVHLPRRLSMWLLHPGTDRLGGGNAARGRSGLAERGDARTWPRTVSCSTTKRSASG